MAKPPFQFGLKAIFSAMTTVAVLLAALTAWDIKSSGVTMFLFASVLLTFSLCCAISLGIRRIYLGLRNLLFPRPTEPDK
jgi:hypothetical protein